MKTIFLAAGTSSRMKPVGDKNLLGFLGKPLLCHLLERAYEAGCDDFVIVASGDNQDVIEEVCGGLEFLKNTKIVTQDPKIPGMAGGISAALKTVDDADDILILNGNDLVEPEAIKSVIREGGKVDGALLGQVRDTYFPGGYLEIDKNHKIESIIEKPGEGNEPSDLVNIVVHYFKKAKDLKQALTKTSSKNDDHYEVALDSLFKELDFRAVKYTGPWQAIKYPWHVLDMMDLMMADSETWISDEAEISPMATLKGDGIVIEPGVKIFENAVICGPCYLGKNVVVGNGALVRHAHIGAGTMIGYNTEIARSWINENVTTHIAYVGDSVVESGVNFGAYSCTANLRLDQKNVGVKVKEDKVCSGRPKLGAIVGSGVQIGVGAKLMPGSTVDKNVCIRPNEVWY